MIPESVTSEGFRRSFQVAFLLTGSIERAEAVLLKAIEKIHPDSLSDETILLAAASAAITADHDGELSSSTLPLELTRVLHLPAGLRHSFVLRILCSFSRVDCARLLQLTVSEVDDRTSAALRRLAIQP
jgi:DNA-directed RNA polymerase specialized sigma24 family protein